MLALTQQFVSQLPNVSCLFGPLTPDGGLPAQLCSPSGQHRVTLMLDTTRLRDSNYCAVQAQQVRRSLGS
jgi:hypothetical protein